MRDFLNCINTPDLAAAKQQVKVTDADPGRDGRTGGRGNSQGCSKGPGHGQGFYR